MSEWNNFFVRKEGEEDTYESVSEWGVFCKDIPFKLMDKVREPAKRTWHDEHGDDEYIGVDGLRLDAYTMKVSFACKRMAAGSKDAQTYGKVVADVRAAVLAFLTWLRESGMMMMYSSYTRIGRQHVRFVGVDDDAVWNRDGDGEFLVFNVELKVNDPVTEVTLVNGELVI